MIVELILTALFAVVGLIIGLFNFPALPQALASVYDSIMQMVYSGLDFVFWLFEGTLLKSVLTLIIALFVLEKGIDGFLWVWHKLHGN